MRLALILAMIALAIALGVLILPAREREARTALAEAGYTVKTFDMQMLPTCMKGRTGYTFTALKHDQQVSGHVCVGGLIGPAITEGW